MQQKSDVHVFQGMQRDIDPHKHKSEYLVDARNIRITSRGEDTEFAITSEKSSEEVTINETLNGYYLGHCVLNQYVIVFTHVPKPYKTKEEKNKCDKIYRLEKVDDEFDVVILYEGNLNFNTDYPIESIGLYENEDIQKVYWTDGNNQPRMINIMKDAAYNNNSFDFSQTLALKEVVNVIKDTASSGSFPAGTIQYAFTYYNKYGAESNIVWQSPLLYTSFIDRGGSPEETIANSFTVEINNVDKNFEYIRLYSIMRTSENAQPTVKIVKDVDIRDLDSSDTLSITDNNIDGSTIDPTVLLYVGGEDLVASTMTHKDGTLFLGNIKINRKKVPFSNTDFNSVPLNFSSRQLKLTDNTATEFYPNEFTLNAKRIDNGTETLYADNPMTFKNGEKYRFGIQLQYKNGKWSEPVFINDTIIDTSNISNFDYNKNQLPIVTANIDLTGATDYKKVRGVIVAPTLQNRKIIAQGLVCPTVYNIRDRHANSPYAQSSWFLRPYPSNTNARTVKAVLGHGDAWFINMSAQNTEFDRTQYVPQYEHDYLLFGGADMRAEIQGIPAEAAYGSGTMSESTDVSPKTKQTSSNKSETFIIAGNYDTNSFFAVDQKIVTFHSADLEFNDDLQNLDYSSLHFRIVGSLTDVNSACDVEVQTSSSNIDSGGTGFLKKSFSETDSLRTICAYPGYEDGLVDELATKDDKIESYNSGSPIKYYIYPWQRSGSLNNDINRPANMGTRTAVLKTKKWSDIKVFKTTTFSNTPSFNALEKTIKLFNFDQLGMVKLGNNIYYGNIDTMINPVLSYSQYYLYKNGLYGFGDSGGVQYQGRGDFKQEGLPFGGKTDNIGDSFQDLRMSKGTIRMKYKSSIHAVIELGSMLYSSSLTPSGGMLIGELYRDSDPDFGGTSEEALKNNLWIPAGEAIDINGSGTTTVVWKYGDTYFQRFDFLKTYAYTQEDENSIIEIGSFRGEFRVNADGRYDRNRGQTSNLVMTPQNFNLFNPVYNSQNNFFNYRMLDKDYYNISSYPNTVTWSLTHNAGEDVDNWTHFTMASTLDLDGSKGKISSLNTFNDTIFAFQDRSVTNILFNSRVQINTSDGVPIEISNNYKVDGYKTLSDSIGCANKWAIHVTPNSIYFIDTNSKELYTASGGGLQVVSSTRGMSNWFKNQTSDIWKPAVDNGSNIGIRTYYDFNNNDLYIATPEDVLNFSEKLGQFVSFYNYESALALFNVENSFYAFTSPTGKTLQMYKLFANDKPANLLGNECQQSISFISNQDSTISKIFSNIELRADWRDLNDLADGEGVNYNRKNNIYHFFDTLQVSNEYQNTGEQDIEHLRNKPSNLKNKFRVWRLNIPRNENSRDRICNPWAKFTLTANYKEKGLPFILHDLNVQYYV